MFDAGRHSFSFLFTVLALFPASSLAEQGSAVSSADILAYDNGEYGSVPIETLRSVDFNVTRISKRIWSPDCEQPDSYYFLNTYGVPAPPHSGPQIIDTSGTTIWFGDQYRGAWTVSPITYKGDQYLSFWVGDPNVRGKGHGEGYFVLLDKHYQLFTTISAAGTTPADMHELSMTANDTALLVVCPTAHRTDLNLLGVQDSNGYISDCSFQELDISTNPATLLFSWQASEHISLAETWRKPDPAVSYNTTDLAIDWIHLNSIEKDKHGNYLISARHTSTIYYISGDDGHIIWRLGGSQSDFADANGGNSTSFMRQHHARWQDVEQTDVLSLFDNGPDTYIRPSRGLQLRLNHTSRTVSLDMTLTHPLGYWSESQGNMQHLSNGNWLIGWGNAGAITEWNENGTEVMCDLQLSALHDKYNPYYNGTYSPGSVWNYRVTREKWVGLPKQAPDVLMDETAVCSPNEYDAPCGNEVWNTSRPAINDANPSPTIMPDSEYGMCTANAPEAPCWEEVSDDDEEVVLHRSAEDPLPGPAKLFISWNGATEVRQWRVWAAPLLDLTLAEKQWPWREVAGFEKMGFESEADVGVVKRDKVFKIEAYDREGANLGTWIYVRGEEREGSGTQLVALDAVFDGATGVSSVAMTGLLSMESFTHAYLVIAVGLLVGCVGYAFRHRLHRVKRKLSFSKVEHEHLLAR